jgi:hypothetical protein
MEMFDAVRRETPVPALARWLLGLGLGALKSFVAGRAPNATPSSMGSG